MNDIIFYIPIFVHSLHEKWPGTINLLVRNKVFQPVISFKAEKRFSIATSCTEIGSVHPIFPLKCEKSQNF